MIKNKLYTALIIFLFLLPYLSCTDLLSKNIIGPDGGTIVTSDGLFTLEIPEGALTEDVEITLTRDEGIEGDVLVYDAEPSGLEFLLPAIFSGDVTDISNNGENDKNIMIGLNVSEDNINYLGGQTYEIELEDGSTLYTAEVDHFSKLVLFNGGVVINNSTVPKVGMAKSKLVDFEVKISPGDTTVKNAAGSTVKVEPELVSLIYDDSSKPMVIFDGKSPIEILGDENKTTQPYKCGDPGDGKFDIFLHILGNYEIDNELISALFSGLTPGFVVVEIESEIFAVGTRGVQMVDCQGLTIGDNDAGEGDADGGGIAGDDDDTNVVDILIPFKDEESITHSASKNPCKTPSITITISALNSGGFPLEGVPIKIGSLPSYLQVNKSTVTTDSNGEADFTINFDCNGFMGSIPSTLTSTITFTSDNGKTTSVKFTTNVVP